MNSPLNNPSPESPRAKRAGKTDTWMPLYIGDYLADTMHLNAEKHGAYLLLLMHLWRTGFLVDNADQLSSIARCDAKTWTKSVWPTLLPFFDLQDGKLYQKRLMAERENATKIRDIRSQVGKKGAAKRWQDDASSDGKSIANACQNNGPSPSPLHYNSLSETESDAPSAPPSPRSKVGRRLSDDWVASEEDRQFATSCGLDPDTIQASFKDYWAAAAGANARKLNWAAAWRNWCRKERPQRPPAGASPGRAGSHLEKSAEIARNNKTRMQELQREFLGHHDDFEGITLDAKINYAR